jgi:hypothetical protein
VTAECSRRLHEVSYPDGKPYREREVQIIREFTGVKPNKKNNVKGGGRGGPPHTET